jgi:hypothetical protein
MAAQTGNKNRQTPAQKRAARRSRRDARKRFLRWGALAGVALISFLFILALFLPGLPFAIGGDAPTGPGQQIKDAGTAHVAPGQEHAPYTSTPATSGPHYAQPLAPVRWGIHTQPLEPEEYVHNLEHGGIAIFYDCPEGCDALVGQLSDLVNEFIGKNGKVLMAPHPNMDTRIALAAWTFLDTFENFDEDRIREFVVAHESSSNAPEPFAR